MKKEVIIVPKDKCPLDVLAEMEERTKNSWIFFHNNVIEKLLSTADEVPIDENEFQKFYWNATDEFLETTIFVDYFSCRGVWTSIPRIQADDIAFKERSDDPEEIFFLKMEE